MAVEMPLYCHRKLQQKEKQLTVPKVVLLWPDFQC